MPSARPLVWLLVAMLLGACSSQLRKEQPREPRAATGEAPFGLTEQERHRIKGLQPELMLRLLEAELSGQAGEVDRALGIYRRLAQETRDPTIIRRATQIALFSKQDDAALELARLWLETEPESEDARLLMASLLLRRGEVDASTAELQRLLEAAPALREQRLRTIASVLSREEDTEAALEVMRRLVEASEAGPQGRFAYALMAVKAGRLDLADRIMLETVTPDSRGMTLALAYLAVLRKHATPEHAATWLGDVVRRHPGNFELELLRARFLAEEKRYDEARRLFAELSRRAPENAEVRFSLALLELQAGRLAQARNNLRRLLRHPALKDQAHLYLGQIAEQEGREKEALDHYLAVAEGPHHFDATMRAALLLGRLEEYERAWKLTQGLEPGNGEQRQALVRLRAELLVEQGRLEEAMELYDQALEQEVQPDLLYARAMLAEKMGRLDILERDLRALLELDPDNAQALNALGYTLADRTDRYEEAYELISRALELEPDNFFILDSMGWILYRLGRLEEAEYYLRRAREIRDDPEVADHLAEVLRAQGRPDDARRILESSLRHNPGDERLLKALGRPVTQ
ncbi:MAG: tetratricopeptide repeat protein [Gammaproteobacteria bacterium]|nr:MAG: tetratricopeptide repeat protein [Gammaproteobacteria bacterium]